MTTARRGAAVLSGATIVLAVLAAVATMVATSATSDHPVTAPVVVGNAAVADGPAVIEDVEERIASGELSRASGGSATDLLVLAIALVWLVTGSLIVSRQPRNLSGWFFMAIGVSIVLQTLANAVVAWALIDGRSVPFLGPLALVGDSAGATILLLPLLILLFPNGRPPSPRWRILVWVLLGGALVWTVGYVLGPGPLNNFVDLGIVYVNPIGVPALERAGGSIAAIGGIAVVLSAIATVPAVRGRYKRSTGEERQQLRWLAMIATVAGSMLALYVASIVAASTVFNDRVGETMLTALWVAMLLWIAIGVPAAYLVAILKHGLWDLDIVIKKAAVAVVLAALIVAVGLLAFGTIGQVGLWQGTPRGVSIAIGLVLGILMIPLLRLARRVAGRITFGRRATPYEILTRFSGQVGETYSTEDVVPRMARVVAEGTGASSARVLLRVGGEMREEASFGEPGGDEEREFPVLHQGEELGGIAVTMPASDPMDRSKERLIEDLALQAGPVLRNVRLIEELKASRQRLVAAQDDARRALERNIHDGAQQELVALSVKLRLLGAMIDRDDARAQEMVGQLAADTVSALDTLRDLAHGIFPPLLADRGLGAALEAQARKCPVTTRVVADGIGRFDQGVEAAVYFSCLEAMQNVTKYAAASRIDISLSNGDGSLGFRVRDDGSGFDPEAIGYGTGLQGIADRLAALDGDLRIESRVGEGTTVIGRVPAIAPAGDRA